MILNGIVAYNNFEWARILQLIDRNLVVEKDYFG
jgi:hypothetical protein